MRPLIDDRDLEPHHAASQTDITLNELQLYGYRPFSDEPDPRSLPEGQTLANAVGDLFEALISSLGDTRLEPDLDSLLWSSVHLFHKASERIMRELDDNEQAQYRLQREQDGSEVKSYELERLISEGKSLIERRDAFELMRDQASHHYAEATGDLWRPKSGSMVSHKHMTSALIDSRDFLNAQKQLKTSLLVPQGVRIAFSGGLDYNEYTRIWDTLDKTLAKHPDMVLLHGGAVKGAELIAAKWADNRKISHIAFKPDWHKHAKAAPFKRNDQMLESLPIGVLIFPGSGIQDNLADKAKKLGIPVWKVT